MGDRGNIAVLQSNSQQVWFYSHWNGYQRLTAIHDALRRGRDRWSDESYLARIIFCSYCPKDQHNDTDSFGISTTIQDNSYTIAVVDIPKQRVFQIKQSALDNGQVPKDYEPKTSASFADFIKSTAEELELDPAQ